MESAWYNNPLNPSAGLDSASDYFGDYESPFPTPSTDAASQGEKDSPWAMMALGVVARDPKTAFRGADVVNRADEVIKETLAANKRNITSQHTVTADEALEAGQKFLGDNYKEIGKPGSGVFRSADGTRQFRIDDGSLSGSHAPNKPHVHLEIYKPGSNKPTVNNHIPFVD